MNQSQIESIEHERLYEGHYVVVMRKDHPLANNADGSPAHLGLEAFCEATHLLVSFSGRPYGFVDEALANMGRRRKILLTVNQFFTAGRVVIESDLLTVLPHHFVDATGFAEKLAVRALPIQLEPVHVEMLWHTRHKRSPALRWLRSLVARAGKHALASLPDGIQQG